MNCVKSNTLHNVKSIPANTISDYDHQKAIIHQQTANIACECEECGSRIPFRINHSEVGHWTLIISEHTCELSGEA